MKKIFIGLIVLLILVIPEFNVKALENNFYEEINEGVSIIKRTSDDRAVYCINNCELKLGNKIVKSYETDYTKYNNIDSNILNKIILIAYYGYNYDNHIDNKWYDITQYMILKKLSNTNIEKYEKEISEINSLIEKHNTLPLFHNKTYEVRYNEYYSIHDQNSSLKDFFVYGTQGMDTYHSTYWLGVRKSSIGLSTMSLVKYDKKYSNNPAIYVDENGRALLLSGKYDPVYTNINYMLPSSKLTVNKLDSITKTNISSGSAEISNTSFQILDTNNKVIMEKETDSNGQVVFELGYGNYILKENKASNGYILNNETLKLNINKEEYNIDYYDQVITNKIIFNSYKDDVKIFDSSYTIYSNNVLVTTFKTNNGKCILELPYGTYTIKKDKDNYELIDDITFTVSEDNLSQEIFLINKEIILDIKPIMMEPLYVEELMEKVGDIIYEETITEVIEVPNTLIYKSEFNLGSILIILGISIVTRKKER